MCTYIHMCSNLITATIYTYMNIIPEHVHLTCLRQGNIRADDKVTPDSKRPVPPVRRVDTQTTVTGSQQTLEAGASRRDY